MATEEVEMKSTEEVQTTEEVQAAEETPAVNGEANGATNGTANGKHTEEEEEHTTEFPGYPQYIVSQLQAQKADTSFVDGAIVFTSGAKRRRVKVLLSSLAIGAIKLNRAFLSAKRQMMEAGFMNQSVDLEIPDFSQDDQSLPESAVKSVFNFMYTGQLDVNAMNLKNVGVLAHYLEIEPITSRLQDLAGQLGISDYPEDDLKAKAASLGHLRVVGMDKFIKAGFGNAPRVNHGKRPNTPKKAPVPEKKAKTLEEPKPEEAVEISQTDEAELGEGEAAPGEDEATTIEQTDDAEAEAAEAEAPADEPAAEEAAEEAEAEAEAEPVPSPAKRGKGRGRGRGRRGRGRGK